jgi:hypothetical protein
MEAVLDFSVKWFGEPVSLKDVKPGDLVVVDWSGRWALLFATTESGDTDFVLLREWGKHMAGPTPHPLARSAVENHGLRKLTGPFAIEPVHRDADKLYSESDREPQNGALCISPAGCGVLVSYKLRDSIWDLRTGTLMTLPPKPRAYWHRSWRIAWPIGDEALTVAEFGASQD